MKIQGKISHLTRRGDFANFVLILDKGQEVPVQVSQALLTGFKEGDLVEIEGELPTDPPFLPRSVRKADPKPAIPWKWIAAAVAACVVLLGIFLIFGRRAKTQPPVPTPVATNPSEPTFV